MTRPLTVGSLFAGIGGFDLAAEWMGWRTLWQSEIDKRCVGWLRDLFPDARQLGDITTIDWGTVERPNILAGGFPCQPHSLAGKRLGSTDARDLWPEFGRAIRALRPDYVAGENVAGLLTSDDGRVFERILADLAALGYDAEWGLLSAGDLGAPQERARLWIVAYPERHGDRGAGRGPDAGAAGAAGREVWEQRLWPDHGAGGSGVGDPDRERRDPGERPHAGERVAAQRGESVGHADGLGQSQRQGDEPGIGGRHRDRGEQLGDPDGGRCEQHHPGERGASLTGPGHVPLGHAGSERREECDPAAEPDGPRRPGWRGGPVGWGDATPYRGADGTVRLIPRDAAEKGPESALWPVADGVPSRVARLRGIGNAIVPLWAIEGPYRRIWELEQERGQ